MLSDGKVVDNFDDWQALANSFRPSNDFLLTGFMALCLCGPTKLLRQLRYQANRGVTVQYPHDTIRIAILESRYDSNRDTC